MPTSVPIDFPLNPTPRQQLDNPFLPPIPQPEPSVGNDQTRRILLDNDQLNPLEFGFMGNAIQITDASSVNVRIGIRFNTPNSAQTNVGRGWSRTNKQFNKIFLTWPAQAGAWIEILAFTEPRPTIGQLNPIQ